MLTGIQDIKVGNKPLFVIYRSATIPKCDEMLLLWQKLAQENGIEGIYFVKTLNSFELDTINSEFNAQIEFEPMYTISYNYGKLKRIQRKIKSMGRRLFNLKSELFLNTVSYDYIWKQILSRKDTGENTFLGAFVDWDNTARKGVEALVIKDSTPDKLRKYLSAQLKRAKNEYNTEFLFINAWNEWAEGTYLEPDKKHGHAYLQAAKDALEENGYK